MMIFEWLKKKMVFISDTTTDKMKRYVYENIKSEFVVLEAGAHDGSDTVEIGSKAKLVYAFEPEPTLYKKLIENTSTYSNIKCFEQALSNYTGESEFYVSSGTSDGSSSILEPQEHLNFHPSVAFNSKLKVKTITIDDFCIQNHIVGFDFLWLDLQGNEYQALNGAINVLKKTKFVFSEVSLIPLYKNSVLYPEFKIFMEKQGFKVKKEFLPYKDAGNVLFEKK